MPLTNHLTVRELKDILSACDDDAPVTVIDTVGCIVPLENHMVMHNQNQSGWILEIDLTNQQ